MSVRSLKSVVLDQNKLPREHGRGKVHVMCYSPGFSFWKSIAGKVGRTFLGTKCYNITKYVISSTLNILASDQEEVRRRIMRLEASPV